MSRVKCVAVWKAAGNGDDTTLHQLLEGVREALRPNIVNCKHHNHGTTPLMAAAGSRRGEGVVWQLIAAGANVNATDNTKMKNSALHYAAMTNNDSQTVDALLASGADAFATNQNSLLPLDLARRHRREAVAAILMEHMKIHSGWLYMRGKLHWKKRWGVVVACNKQRTSSELCIFQHPGDVRPEAVLLVDESARVSLLTHNNHFFNSERRYAFTFDKPVMWQSTKRQKLTRSPICRKTVSLEHVQIRDLVFAADNLHSLECWQRVLQSSNFYDRETGAPIYRMPPQWARQGELYYWPHNLFHSVHSLVCRRQKSHEDSKSLSEQSSGSLSQTHLSENEELLADILRGLDELNHTKGESQGRTLKTVEVYQPLQHSTQSEDEPLFVRESRMEAIQTSSSLRRRYKENILPLCPTCHVENRNAVCAPCGHRSGCHTCLKTVMNTSQCCPLCRARVRFVMKVYD